MAKYNDNYAIYNEISKKNNKVLIITQRENINKGRDQPLNPKMEISENIIIHRIFNRLKHLKSFTYQIIFSRKIYSLTNSFKPDIIICEEVSNFRMALRLKKKLKIPLVTRVEFAYNPDVPYRQMERFLSKFKNPITKDFIPKLIGTKIWNWVTQNSEGVISCFFEDNKRDFSHGNDLLTTYIPWPSNIPIKTKSAKKNKDTAVFIGAFDRHKNLEEFLTIIPELLNKSVIEKFIFVGTGDYLYVVNRLKNKYPDNIIHIPSLERNECLEIIQNSFVSISTATRGGWGFIGDSFAMKTPIVCTNNHYDLAHLKDSIITSPKDITNDLEKLKANDDLYNSIIKNGYLKYQQNHNPEKIANQYLDFFNRIVSKRV